MDTAPLKSFATRARTDLIAEVSAGVRRVLAPASPERIEQPGAVAALEKAISAAGGGEAGRAVVADKVAYTWFNRIIALRFMDANGYTGVGVVSPARGQAGGQPEILAEAKRGTIDTTVVTNKSTVETITGLLDGTRRSDDPQGEAYASLLAEYCRHWNRAMPFMFEREGDYTELLIPANLLADDSVLARAVASLTEDVCQDVEVIGWLYQFYISERKDEVFAGFKKGIRAGAAEIPAATQLFTPHWIVRYLVENSLGRLWLLNRPKSRLADRMEYYYEPVDEEPDFLEVASPEELKIIDPACGSGHMLTYAFDLLYAIYQEEGYAPADIPSLILTHNLYGVEIDPRAGALAAFALTMKARAKQRTLLTKGVQPNICVLEPITFTPPELDLLVTGGRDRAAEVAFWKQFQNADISGSLIAPNAELIPSLRRQLERHPPREDDLLAAAVRSRAARVIEQAEYLQPRYMVLVANPPYMGSKNMSPALSGWVATNYAEAKSDLFAAFLARAPRLLLPLGRAGFMTPNVWLYIASHESLRSKVVLPRLRSLVELPLGGFRGATVQICALTLVNMDSRSSRATFVRLVDLRGDEDDMARFARAALRDDASAHRFVAAPKDFEDVPGRPIVYWFSETLLAAFRNAPKLSSIARAAKGMVTANNAQYVRNWSELSLNRIGFGAANRAEAAASGKRWFPYAKGGDFRRWAGNVDSVVNWERDGHELQHTLTDDGMRVRATNFNLDRIFKPGVVWTVITSSASSFRLVDRGHLFADASGVCQSSDNAYLLALLNSSAAGQVLAGLNPTLNLQPGNLSAVPAPRDADPDTPRQLALRAVELSRRDWALRETAWEFQSSPIVGITRKIAASLEQAAEEWNDWVVELTTIERRINDHFDRLYGLPLEAAVDMKAVSLSVNPAYRYAERPKSSVVDCIRSDAMGDLVSYAIGCILGRYSLDAPGLILANQGDTLEHYFAKVPNPSFTPDRDNVIPIVDGDWFEDDIVARFRKFLSVAFGEQHLEENLRFVTESLGVKDLREYFLRSFYKDHVQRYRKRPIYWLFSSPKGSFNALIYMHRYSPSTVSTVLNEYLREFKAKLDASRQHHERLAAGGGTPRQQAAALKEADRLRKVLLELDEYEHDVLYPLATQQVTIDLDDGVKANYPKFGAALKKITGLEASDE